MQRSRLVVFASLLCAVLLAGCASKVTEPEQYSGFLADYSQLQPATSATGQPVLRWLAPGFNFDNYQHMIVQEIGFYPTPSPSGQIGAPALNQLQTYTSEQVKVAFGRRIQVHEEGTKPGPQTLILRAAITGVDTRVEGLKPYEVIPIALVVAATTSATGARDRTTELFVEAELLDASTGQPVLRVVRKGYGKQLENKEEQVTLATLKGVIDDIVRDIEKFE